METKWRNEDDKIELNEVHKIILYEQQRHSKFNIRKTCISVSIVKGLDNKYYIHLRQNTFIISVLICRGWKAELGKEMQSGMYNKSKVYRKYNLIIPTCANL